MTKLTRLDERKKAGPNTTANFSGYLMTKKKLDSVGQGTLTEGEGLVQLTFSLGWIVL
jgi:hypothetical protein